jgi:hypothetical protein
MLTETRPFREIAMFLPIAARKFSLLSYWLVAGFGDFSAAFLYPLRIS